MSRKKVLKSMGRDGQRRRSPRISALDCKENRQRTRMKRKLDDSGFAPVSKLAKQVWKGRDSSQITDNSADFVEWRSVGESRMIEENQKHNDRAITNGKSTIMPAKHILELVLDTLQRRDTYEIFAEPVDPDEVEEYYEIIKEPMDFGTMRAKLHEGMYQNLQQFEHDVLLIPENAMHFNSSTTVYFRQARAVHDLAKKVFHVLKTDPENFVSEFSGTRRRSMRKALSETKDSRFAIAKSAGVYSQQCPSTFRRTNKKIITDHFHARSFFTGIKDGRLSSDQVSDRRITYLGNDKSSNFYSSCNALVLMNQGDISYKDSLMSYVKDLGPTAQMVANRKLLGHHESIKHPTVAEKSPNSTAKEFKTFRDFAPSSTINPFLKASKNVIIDLTKDAEEEEETKCRNQIKEKTETDNNGAKGKEKIDVSKRSAITVTRNPPLPVGREMNCSSSRGNDHKARPVILALENSHCNGGDFKSRIKRNGVVSKPLMKTRDDEGQRPPLPVVQNGVVSKPLMKTRVDEGQKEEQRPPLPVVPRFAFDLPFLKARLSQMTAVEIGRKSRC